MAERYAVLVKQALELQDEALECNKPVPQAPQGVGIGLCDSLRTMAELAIASRLPVEEENQELVPQWLGAIKGLTPLQHVTWAGDVEHPSAKPPPGVFPYLVNALRFEVDNEIEDIDAFRQGKLYRWVHEAKRLEESGVRERWLQKCPEVIQPLCQAIHGPGSARFLTETSGDPSFFANLNESLKNGFPRVGDLPPCEGA